MTIECRALLGQWPIADSTMRFLAIATAMSLLASHAIAGSLSQPDDVDLTQLDPATRQLQLLVILDDDHVDSRQSMRSLHTKLIRYQRYIASGQALKDSANVNANVNADLRPLVMIVAPLDATPGEMQNLAGVKLAFGKHGIDIGVQPYMPGLRARPRRIEP